MTVGRLQSRVAKYKGKWVYCYAHQFMGERGISNWVDFQFIRKDGTVGKKAGDYDNGPFKGARWPRRVIVEKGEVQRVEVW